MASPQCTVNATSTLNGVDVTPATTATIALADTAGVKQWSITCINTDELTTAAAINATLTVDQITKTATFTVPAAGSALIFQSKVNNGQDVNGRTDTTLTTTFGVFTLTGASRRVAAFDEKLEGSLAFGWITKVNAIIRDAASSAGTAGDGLVDSLGTISVAAADQTIIVNPDSIQVRCGDGLLANGNGVSIAAGDATIVVGANAIQVNPGDGLVANGNGVSVVSANANIVVNADNIQLSNTPSITSLTVSGAITAASGAFSGAITSPDITVTGSTNRYKLGSRTISRGVAKGILFSDGASTWGFLTAGNTGVLVQNVGATGLIRYDLDLPHDAVVNSIAIAIDPQNGHGANYPPGVRPKIDIYREGTSGGNALLATATDASGSAAIYEGTHFLTATPGAPFTVDRLNNIYYAIIRGESGIFSLSGLKVYSPLASMTITSMDDS